MIDVRINEGDGHIDVQGTLLQITTDSLILVNWIYEAIRQDGQDLADLFAEKFLTEVKLALDPNFEAKMRLKAMLKGVEEIVEMFKKGKEDSEA